MLRVHSRKARRTVDPVCGEHLARDAALVQRAVIEPRVLNPSVVLALQRQSGNAAVAGLLAPHAPSGPDTGGAKANDTGVPDRLKVGAEELSGVRLDDVRVRYGSTEPGRLQAHAYTEGSDIHLASGQEQQLGHELWHVVQQKQGRVPATGRVGGVAVNDDARLEQEADAVSRALEGGAARAPAGPAGGPLVGVPQRVAQLAKKPKVTHQTKFAAPDGSASSRRTVGVGEQVTFQGDAVGNWTAAGGGPTKLDASDTFTWTAPNRAGKATVRLTVGKKTAAVKMKTVEPTGITGKKNGETAIPAGTAGAGMTLTFHYHPKSVSFGNVEAGEVSGPATGIWGYYKKHYTAADLWHDSGDHFTPIGEDNRDLADDTAQTIDTFTPYRKGGFKWVIPNRFRVDGEGGNGKVFTHVTQAFRMLDKKGTIRVTKAGARVERAP